jgi:molybdate transport system substrate-binding protein
VKLQFVSAGAAHALVQRVATARALEAAGSFGAVGAMQENFLAGEPCDVVILTDAQIGRLMSERRVAAGASADLGSVATAIAVRAGDKVPAVGDERQLRAALLGASAIYFPDPAKATAGIHFTKVIDRLGIRDKVAARLRTFPNGATAMRAMAEATDHPVGCTQATEILATRGVRLVAPLPRGLHLDTVYTAGVSAAAARAREAHDFVAALAGDDARGDRVAAGFEGYVIRPAASGDTAAIRDVVATVLAEYGLRTDPSGIDSDLADIAAAYGARGGAFDVVVASDGSIAGSCGLYPLDAAICELRKMYLRNDVRGLGLGGRLLARALAVARARGFRRIELETASVLKAAIALYTGAGFLPIERAHRASRCDQAFALDLE